MTTQLHGITITPPHLDLLPFQVEAIEKMIKFIKHNASHSCYNASEQGLGKTIQVISLLNYFQPRSVLILCPSVMMLTWKAELEKWSTNPNMHICADTKPKALPEEMELSDYFDYQTFYTGKSSKPCPCPAGGKDGCRQAPWGSFRPNYFIVSYDSVWRLDTLPKLKQKFEFLILDEFHYLKSSKAKRTKAVLKDIWPLCQYKIACSGTPFTTKVIDGYTAFHNMLPDYKYFKNFYAFAEQYSLSRYNPFAKGPPGSANKEYYGVKNPEELSKVIRGNFYIRYLKKDVLKELPPKVFTPVYLPSNLAVKPQGTKEEILKIETQKVMEAIKAGTTIVCPASLAEHRRLQGENKIPAAIQFIQDQLDQEIPLVVFAHHKNVLAALSLHFASYSPAIIAGETPMLARKEAITRFQAHKTLLFLGSTHAAGIGITLTAASTVLFVELDWSPAVIGQACDRLHRIGQLDTVQVYYLVVQNSLDETISSVLMERMDMFKKVLDDTPNWIEEDNLHKEISTSE